MKIVGIGLNKTGTTTLGECLQYWGLKHVSWNHAAFDLWRHGRTEELLEWVERYDSFEDWPWMMVYREIDQAYPGSKFILTRRKDADTWYRSLCRHARRTGPTDFRKYGYGYAMPQWRRRHHVRLYEQHLESVRNYFRGRSGDLLEVCWEEGDGWDELSDFLGFERPALTFPHANPSPSRNKIVTGARRRLRKLANRMRGSAREDHGERDAGNQIVTR